LDSLVFADRPVAVSDSDAYPVMLNAIKRIGLDGLPLRKDAGGLRERILWLRRKGFNDSEFPDLSSEALEGTLEDLLGGFLWGKRKLSELCDLTLDQLLSPVLPYHIKSLVDQLAPCDITVPTGRSVKVDYLSDQAPAISVRLQELFGLSTHPTVGNGKIPLTIFLLSPAGRAVQVTADLPGFWRNSYKEVRKEMQGRYPRHSWPIDPESASPLRGTKKRG
jgi:ATP-dependent helicase HrpB